MKMSITDEARRRFKESGIIYKNITRQDIVMLENCIRAALENHTGLTMRLSKIVHFKEDATGFIGCNLYVNGNYFKRRQSISFESYEWIGFSGWASTNNTQVFVQAFDMWLYLMIKRYGLKV